MAQIADFAGARGGEQAALTLGQRAAIELRLSDARRDLQAALEERTSHTLKADEFRALAAEAESSQARVRRNAECIKYRVRAAAVDVSTPQARVTLLEGMLNGRAAAPAPALTRDQVDGMDDTAGALA